MRWYVNKAAVGELSSAIDSTVASGTEICVRMEICASMLITVQFSLSDLFDGPPNYSPGAA